ncbi:hypothetical protein H0E84_04635 [Luteimonas sp. SJ-92]|uniref:Uncharacterized protein n=1 Tax=Luteimonas salinisoli TaxID=2752307 RepID=A0A853JAJ9_9GAMM|nr:hypothetical protein [Luteimonas salinisoli]NZA25660.1 hypothetical protein [Luteimonas salinisoli]
MLDGSTHLETGTGDIMRMKRLLAAIAGIAIVGGIWLLAHDTQLPGRRADAHARPAESAGAAPGKGVQRQSVATLPEGPFDSVRAELESRARAGDAEAAYRLGNVLGHCLSYERMPMGAFIAIIAQAAAYFGDAFQLAGRPIDSDITVDALLDARQEMDELCKGTEDLAETAGAADAHAWMLRAVALGHTTAMAHYPDHAFTEFKTHAELLDNADEVARRRDRAKTLIGRALKAGEPEALYAYATAHGPDGILQDDPVRMLAYWSAYRQVSTASEAMGKLEAAGRERFSPAQIREAELMSSRILGAFHRSGEGR